MGDEKLLGKYWKNLKGKGLLLLLAALGILLLLFGGGSGNGVAEGAEDGGVLREQTESYRQALEEELTALCSKVRGAGQVSLLITLEGSEEKTYAADTTQSGAQDYVIQGGEGLLLGRQNPKVTGVAVVCTGGADPAVCRELTSLICAALNIGSNRVYICAGG